MSSKTNTGADGEVGEDDREERLTAFYAALNEAASNARESGEDTIRRLPAVSATPSWAGPDGGPGAVLETVFDPVLERAGHVQALPERFVTGSDDVAAIGSFVGRTRTGSEFEIPFVHVYEFREGSIRGFTSHTDSGAIDRAFPSVDRP